MLGAVRVGVVGNIFACHADAPGSIPGRGDVFFWWPETLFRAKTQLLICSNFFWSGPGNVFFGGLKPFFF